MREKYYIKKEVFLQEDKGEGYAVDLNKERVLTLNNTANQILKRIQEGYNTRDIVRQLSNKYPTHNKEVENDIADLIEDFLKKGIITSLKQVPDKSIKKIPRNRKVMKVNLPMVLAEAAILRLSVKIFKLNNLIRLLEPKRVYNITNREEYIEDLVKNTDKVMKVRPLRLRRKPCLIRSLIFYRHLKKINQKANLNIGLNFRENRRLNFHAWLDTPIKIMSEKNNKIKKIIQKGSD